MANEVNIRITATDLTGPAFAAALAKMEALKSASKGAIDTSTMSDNIDSVSDKIDKLKENISDMSIVKIGTSEINSSLTSIKSRVQSLGIADIADINIPQGRIITQLQFLKRLIQQAGIADIMDMNINQSSLTKQLGWIGQLSETIPVNFDIGKLPKFSMTGLSVPINYDASKIPKFGDVSSLTAWDDAVKLANADMGHLAISWDDAVKASEDMGSSLRDSDNAFSDALKDVLDYSAGLDDGTRYGAMFGDLFSNMLPNLANMWDNVTNGASGTYRVLQFLGQYMQDKMLNAATSAGNAWRAFPSSVGDAFNALRDIGSYMGGQAITGARLYASSIGDGLVSAMASAGSGTRSLLGDLRALSSSGFAVASAVLSQFNDNFTRGIPMWQSGGILWGGLGGHLSLFGGALNGMLPAFIATASGIHMLIDGIIEVGATLIPAALGLAAFAAAGVDSADEIYNHFVNMDKVIDMTGQSVYPLTGAFSKMNQAAQPEVYVLLGEGLQVVNKNAGLLQSVALAAGSVLDQLGARFTYAMTQGAGFSGFMKNSASDLAGWGDLIGNIGGILGNFFKVMPGYAEVILNVADAFSHFVENVTGSGIGEKLIGIGLAAHGAFLYIGLLGTAAALLVSKTLAGLAPMLLNIGLGFGKIGASGAANVMGDFAAQAESAATLPWGWITIAAAAIGVLIYSLVNAKSAAQQFASGVQQSITAVKLSALGSTITDDITNYSTALYYAKQQQNDLASSAHEVKLPDFHGVTHEVIEYSQAYYQAKQNVEDYSAVIQTAQQDQSIYNSNMKIAAGVFGSASNALAAFNNAGISSSQFLTTSKQQFAESIIEAEGYNDAIKSLATGTGRYAAAMNALSGPEQFLGDMLHSIQSITQAQDNLMTVVTEGESSLDTFALGLATMTSNFGATSNAASTASHTLGDIKNSVSLVGAAMGGTTQADYTMQQSFYSQVTSGQQVIDALEQQEASTKNLTTATATIAAQMIPFAGNNDAARATIVAMINDALGPGTVSLKNLNTWVNNNSTSLQGLNGIIAQSTIKAGQLANVLQTQLTSQFQADLLKSSGATQAMQQFTDALTHGGDETSAYHNARQNLINDLEKTGISAQDAKSYVQNLQGQINALKGKTVSVGLHMSGSGGISETSTLPGMSQTTAHMVLGGLSTGGLLPGFGGGDKLLRLLEPGEAVVDKYRTRKYAGLLAMMGVPGMSAGGLVDTAGGYGVTFTKDWEGAFGQSAANDLKSALGKIKPTGGGPYPSGGGSASTNQAIARALMPSWTDVFNWTDWVALWNQESGWNQFANNPSSGAYGIPQALPFTKMPQAAWPASAGGSSNVYAQEQWGIGYISGRYGNPQNAWAHELQYNWYDNGGWLKPGMNLAYNGTGRPEHLSNDTGGGSGSTCLEVTGGNSDFEQFMVKMLKKWVRVRGGGNVQSAFGKNN
jgi:hypothetical protein